MSEDRAQGTAASGDAEFVERAARLAGRGWFQRVLDWFYGYDYFISYRWSDGRSYALGLAEQLEQDGFDCFLDSADYIKGDNWKRVGERALRKTSRLVLVGSPHAVRPDPPRDADHDPVLRELQIFTATGKRVIPINFDGSLSSSDARDSALARYLDQDGLWIQETRAQLSHGPSAETLEALRSSFDLERQSHKRSRVLRILIVVFALLALAAITAALIAAWQWHETSLARDGIASQLAQQWYDNANEESEPGRDSRLALHFAARAAAVAPNGDSRRPVYIDRAIHLAAALPQRIVNFAACQRELVHAVVSDDLRYVLGVTSDYTVIGWRLDSGERLVLPCEDQVVAGFSLDSEVNESERGVQSLAISPDSRMALALTGGWEDTLWIWELASGKLLLKQNIEWTDKPLVFSRDGRCVLFQEPSCDHEDRRTENSRCCRRTVWAAEGAADDCAELDEPFDHRASPASTVVVYRGSRVFNVVSEAASGDGRVRSIDDAGARPERWIAARRSADQLRIVTVAPVGSAWFWQSGDSSLAERVPLPSVVTAAFHPAGTCAVVLHGDGRLERWYEGAMLASERLDLGDSETVGKGRLRFSTDGKRFLMWYVVEADGDVARTRLELRDGQSLRLVGSLPDGLLRSGPNDWIGDLAASDDGQEFVIAERNADSLYVYIRTGGFAPARIDRGQEDDKVNLTEFGGLTADATHVIQASRGATEIKFVDATDPTKTVFGPLPFGGQRGIQRENTRLLREAYAIQAIEDGISGQFTWGPEFVLTADPAGSRLALNGVVLGSARTDTPLTSSHDGRVWLGWAPQQTFGGEFGADRLLLLVDAPTGYTLGESLHPEAVPEQFAFSPDGRWVLSVTDKLGYRRMYAGGAFRSPPGWMARLAEAATGTEMLEDMSLRTLPPADHARVRQSFLDDLRLASESGDPVAALLRSHLGM
ncbi:MAG: TIR domain-containing protein [Pirellulaceae bacterium]|nr:TIR domain-containing protein [Pirellulaceae bacterium]